MKCKNCEQPVIYIHNRYQHIEHGLLRCRINGIFQLTVAEPVVTSLVAQLATCRCEQEIANTGDGWWHRDTGHELCYPEHADINQDMAEPRLEPGA